MAIWGAIGGYPIPASSTRYARHGVGLHDSKAVLFSNARWTKMKRTLLSILLISRAAMSQQPHPVPEEDHETIQQLLKRVQYLEAQLSELKAQRAAAPGVPATQAPPVETPRAQSNTATPGGMSHEAP